MSNGYFDAYLPTATENNIQSRIEELVDEREHSPIASSVHSNISANISLSQSSETDQSISSSLIKKRRRRARFTNYTRKKQIKKAQKKYRQNQTESRYKENTTMRLWKSKVHSGMAYDPDIAYKTDTCVALGSMTYKCQWCNALKWKDETLGMCCSAGKVQLERLKQLPEPLYSLVNALHPDHVQFMNNIRKYNACFQMTSFGGKQVTADGFLPTFKVKGQVYHLIGSILPEPGQGSQYLQIYFVGEDEREVNIRCFKYPNLKPNLIKQLQDMLHQVNPYIKDLKSAIDKIPPSVI